MTPAERQLALCICEVVSSEKFWLSYFESRGVLHVINLLFNWALFLCLINYDWNEWNKRNLRNVPE